MTTIKVSAAIVALVCAIAICSGAVAQSAIPNRAAAALLFGVAVVLVMFSTSLLFKR